MASGANITPAKTATATSNLPQSYQNFESIYPNLTGTTTQATSNILNELQGQLSPATVNAIQDNAARFGVTSGLPGSNLTGNTGLRNLGLSTESVQGQGLNDFLNTIKGMSGTLTPTTSDIVSEKVGMGNVGVGHEANQNQLTLGQGNLELGHAQLDEQIREALRGSQLQGLENLNIQNPTSASFLGSLGLNSGYGGGQSSYNYGLLNAPAYQG